MAKGKKTTEVEQKAQPPTTTCPSEPAAPAEGNGEQRPAERGLSQGDPPPKEEARKPLRVLTYQVNHDVYIQASIWDRQCRRRDGVEFTTYDVTVRKRWKDVETGEWKSAYGFAPNELYAVVHALEAAAAVILELRTAEVPF